MRGSVQSRSILYSERCAHICLAPSQNSIVWRLKHVMYEPILNLFLDGITARGFALSSLKQVQSLRESAADPCGNIMKVLTPGLRALHRNDIFLYMRLPLD